MGWRLEEHTTAKEFHDEIEFEINQNCASALWYGPTWESRVRVQVYCWVCSDHDIDYEIRGNPELGYSEYYVEITLFTNKGPKRFGRVCSGAYTIDHFLRTSLPDYAYDPKQPELLKRMYRPLYMFES